MVFFCGDEVGLMVSSGLLYSHTAGDMLFKFFSLFFPVVLIFFSVSNMTHLFSVNMRPMETGT